MRHLHLLLIAGLAGGCTATINSYGATGDKRGNVEELNGEDAAAPWDDDEAPDAGKPKTAPVAMDAGKPPTPPTPMDAGKPPAESAPLDAGKPPTTPAPMDAGSMPPMAAMMAAGSVSPKPAADAAAACDFRGLVQMKCGNASCHGAPATNTGLDLTSPSLAMRVAGRKGPSACSSKLLIDTANPKQSALYLKVTGTSCGSQMPLGGTLSASEQACVLSWIEAL